MFRDPPAKGPRPAAPVPPVRRRTVTEEVLDRLRDLLLRGVLKPGTRIDQADLAKSFGVSTVPVREALLRLQSAGLVELVPHRGVFVSQVSIEELLDIYTTRELLEEQAARLAVEHLTAADMDALERITSSMQHAASKQQLDELLAQNREFHFTIYRASGRRHLLQLIEQLWDLSTRYAHLQLHAVPDRASEALFEIRSIVSACKRRDADAVGLMIRYKVHQTTTGLLQHMSLPDKRVPIAQLDSEAPPKSGKKAPSSRKKVSAKGKTATSTAVKTAKGTKASAAPRAKAKARSTSGSSAKGGAARRAKGRRGT